MPTARVLCGDGNKKRELVVEAGGKRSVEEVEGGSVADKVKEEAGLIDLKKDVVRVQMGVKGDGVVAGAMP